MDQRDTFAGTAVARLADLGPLHVERHEEMTSWAAHLLHAMVEQRALLHVLAPDEANAILAPSSQRP